MKSIRHLPKSLAAAAGLLSLIGSAQAAVGFQVVFNDPGATYASYYGELQSTIAAAGTAWTNDFAVVGSPTLTINVSFAHIPTGNGGSVTSQFVGYDGTVPVYEQGAAYRIEGGAAQSNGAADINFTVGIDGYLQNELFFDSDPFTHSAPVPSTQTEAFGVFEHEFGHAFGFNGWRNASTNALPGNYESTFDRLVVSSTVSGLQTQYFIGAHAEAVYGGPVPLTFANYGHVGNNAPRDGSNLLHDLMNGIVFYRGVHYGISALDLAVMADIGLPVISAVPEPGSAGLMLAGVLTIGALGRRKGRRQRHAAPGTAA